MFETGMANKIGGIVTYLQKTEETAYRSDYGYRRCDEWIPFKHRNLRNHDSGSYWNCSEVRVFPFQIVNAALVLQQRWEVTSH